VISLIVAVLREATPMIYVAMAGVLAQRAGVWNLGLEGLMITGACAGVVVTERLGSVLAGVAGAVLLSVVLSVLLWVVIEKLRANPIIAGLGLTGLGLSGTDLAVQAIYGSEAAVTAPAGIPTLGPAYGILGVLDVLVLLMPLTVLALWVLLRRTRFGLRLAACGEHPFAARSVGADPGRMRLLALVLGGVLAGLGGADLSLGGLQIFSINMTAGRGFMAFAAVIFGAAHPLGTTLAVLFFSLVEYLGIKAQLVFGENAPRDFILMLPYLATVLGIWISARLRGGAVVNSAELRDS
jgi:ABC-type uncharacterized transport system permease subunit